MVVTSLSKEAVPLIRYRTHDLSRLIPEPCPCGRAIPRHGHIRGRSDDMIIFRGVNIYPGQIADVLNLYPDVGGEYHIELTRSEGLDYMRLRVERQSGVGSGNDAGLPAPSATRCTSASWARHQRRDRRSRRAAAYLLQGQAHYRFEAE